MKKRLYIAFILYLAGLMNITDWYAFAYRNHELLKQDFLLLKAKYIDRFPDIIKPLYAINPQPIALIFTATLIISGIIFINEKKTIYTILGISSFLFAFQHLFSVM